MRACIDPNQTGFVGKGGDHLQLIKFWPSRVPGNGVCRGAKIFGSALLLQPARSVCVSSERFFYFFFYTLTAHYDSRFVHCSIVFTEGRHPSGQDPWILNLALFH